MSIATPLAGLLLPLGGPRAAFSPPSVPGLQAWYKADKGVWKDTGGTTPATADGDAVARWDDQSGNGRHATTAGTKPTYKPATLNGRPTILPATSVSLSLAPSVALSGAFTVYGVGSRASGQVFWITAASLAVLGGYLDNNIYAIDDANTARSLAYAGAAGNVLWRMRRAGSASAPQFRGGGQAESALSGTVGTVTVTQLFGRSGSNQWTNINVAEILIFNRDVVADDAANGTANDASIRTYLNARWGVTI